MRHYYSGVLKHNRLRAFWLDGNFVQRTELAT